MRSCNIRSKLWVGVCISTLYAASLLNPSQSLAADTRIEHDSIGDLEIPDNEYYGVQTSRALEISLSTRIGWSISPTLLLPTPKSKRPLPWQTTSWVFSLKNKMDAVIAACDELISGKLHDQFVEDMIQGGAGTSTNMNVNEVIANRGLEIMGHARGEYNFLHPNDDVNMSQSTNDTYPTAAKLAIVMGLKKP